ncbi:MAG: extracellular solute-binding protein [Limnochordia bacterium]|jgi:multiple sugar transport system substrate-binding protein
MGLIIALIVAHVTLAAGAELKGSITFGWKGTLQAMEITKEMLKTFELQHPDVEVDFVYLMAGGGSWEEKLKTMILAGSPPDVTKMEYQVGMPLAIEGLLLPLDGLAARDPEFRLDAYFPVALDAHRYRGQLYGLPQEANLGAVFYNAEMFEAAGLLPPTGDWSHDDIVEWGKKLAKDIDGDGLKDTFAIDYSWGRTSMEPHIQAFNGTGYMASDGSRTMLGDPGFIQAMQWVVDTVHSWGIANNPRRSRGSFAGGNVALFYNGPWMITGFRSAKFRWDAALSPVGPKGRGTRLSSDGLQISRQSKYSDAAWELAKFMAGQEVQLALAKAGYLIPSLRRLAQSQTWRSSPPDYEPFIQSAAWSLPEVIVPRLSEVRRIYDNALNASWLLEQTPQAAFSQAAAQINALLRENK